MTSAEITRRLDALSVSFQQIVYSPELPFTLAALAAQLAEELDRIRNEVAEGKP